MNIDLYLDNRCAFFQPEAKEHTESAEDDMRGDSHSREEPSDGWTAADTERAGDSDQRD